MSLVNITNIVVDDQPQSFLSPIVIDIYFDVLTDIDDEIEWMLVFIGSPKDESYDQVLDQFSMGPLQKGAKHFTLECNPPDWKKIPPNELLGITAFILSCSYHETEFFRVGYYVYTSYTSQENIENEPPQIIIQDISRQIFNNKPRITRFEIDWKTITQNQQSQQTKELLYNQEKQSADITDMEDPQRIQNIFDS